MKCNDSKYFRQYFLLGDAFSFLLSVVRYSCTFSFAEEFFFSDGAKFSMKTMRIPTEVYDRFRRERNVYRSGQKAIGLFLLLVALLLTPALSHAIVVNDVANDGVTTAQITAALQGSGVTISNLVIVNNGCANRTQAVGLFSQGTTPTGPGPVLGDASGVVLSTGPLKPADPLVSPNNQANWTNALCGNVTDPDMIALEGQTSNGEYIAIEFDIVPDQTIMTIPFQFGSDEFPEYVCTAFNDVTGIFVSGPGITGPYSNNAENFAKTPGGDLTSINWVNTGVVGINGNLAQCGSLTNTAYYTDNSNGSTTGGNATVATTNANLELDGWTNYIYQPITVVPGATYHIKAAIADAGDRQWDSAVFFHLIFSSGTLPGFDFGDAPDTYRTLTSNGGPRHGISSNIFLGANQPDNEVTGLPTVTALGDDLDNSDDEDGVASFPALSASATSYSFDVTVNNTTGSAANLVGWVDFNGNGTFDTAEGVSVPVATGTVNGTATLNWTGLSGLASGTTYARLRLTTDAAVTTATPGGSATDGEVEDYTLTITAPDLSTSDKNWVDLNGGDQNPGDTLRYTITLTESGGIVASGVSLTDTIDANLNWVGVQSCPSGATCSYAAGMLTVSNVSVPANSSVTIMFNTTIAAGTPIGTLIDNSAMVINPSGPGAIVVAPTVTVSASSIPVSGNKQIYLSGAPAYTLSRIPTAGTPASITLNETVSQTWTLTPTLLTPVTISPSVNPTVPVNLFLGETGNQQNRTVAVTLTCVASGTSLTQTRTVDLNPALWVAFNLPFPGGSDVTCTDQWQLTVQNNTTGGGQRAVILSPVNGGQIAQVVLPSLNVINVDTVTFYNDTYANGGTQVTSVNPGDTISIRAEVSDPFGSFDITGATLDLDDSGGSPVLTSVVMTEVNDDTVAGIKTYEYLYTVPVMPPLGAWTAAVTSMEGTEGTITDTTIGSFTVVSPATLTILKSADLANANPGQVITYTITVENTGGSSATTVQVDDALSPYITMILDYDGTSPPYEAFEFVPGTSGLTIDESTGLTYFDSGGPYIPNFPAGEDGNVVSWQLDLTGSFNAGSQFTLRFKVRVK